MTYNYPGLTIVISNQPSDYKLPTNVQLLEVPNIHPAELQEWLESVCIVVNCNPDLKYVVFTYNVYIPQYINNLTTQPISKQAAKHLTTKNYNAFINKDKVEVYDVKYNLSGHDPDYGFHWDSLSDVSVDITQRYFKIYETSSKETT